LFSFDSCAFDQGRVIGARYSIEREPAYQCPKITRPTSMIGKFLSRIVERTNKTLFTAHACCFELTGKPSVEVT
jgi:hypothetical protein